jgi:hypothetical protein
MLIIEVIMMGSGRLNPEKGGGMQRWILSLIACLCFCSSSVLAEAPKVIMDSSLKKPVRAKTPAKVSSSVGQEVWPQGGAVNPAVSANVNAAVRSADKVNARDMAAKRNMVIIGQIQFTHVSGDTYNWQASANNISGQMITRAVLMPSKYTNGSWVPAGDQQTRNLLAGTTSLTGTGSMADATKFKIDVLAKKNGDASPLEIIGSKVSNFSPNTQSMTDNINISNVTVMPYENRFKWQTTITNNNPTAFNAKILVDAYEFYDGQWDTAGGTSINQIAAGASSPTSLTFWRNANSTQFKIVLTSNGQVIKESAPIPLEPINSAIVLSNTTVTKQGTIASWSTTLTNSGNILLSNVRIKTYQRSSGGQWSVASNTQSSGTLAIGGTATAGNMFSFGTSTQLKIEVIATNFAGGNDDITLATQEIDF